MSKIVTFSPQAKEQLIEGVNVLANAVGVTLGPKGRNVVITAYGVPAVTKDGVTVAKQISLPDPIHNLGAAIIKQAAVKTLAQAGDGTTTSIVVAQALVNAGQTLINKGISPIEIKRGYEECLEEALDTIRLQAEPVTMENVRQIATISANNDPLIGELIYEGFKFVSTDGLIAVEDSKLGNTYVATIDGTSFNSGFISPLFVTDTRKMETVFEKPLFLISDKKIRNTNELVPALELASKAGRPIVLIADEFEAQALNALVVNRVRGGFPLVAVRAPAFGERRAEILKDLSILTGAKLISETEALRLEDFKAEYFGSAEKIVVTSDATLIMNPKGDKTIIEDRIEELRNKLSGISDTYSIEKTNERMAQLTGKVAVLYVGAPTETELKEKKDRIDDALRATKAAIQKGYVEGGGVTLLRAVTSFDNGDIQSAFSAGLAAPYDRIMINANLPTSVVEGTRVIDMSNGVNALTGQKVNMKEAGIIDPLLVIEQALTNAVSAANMILLSEVTVHDTQPQYDPRAGTEFEYE